MKSGNSIFANVGTSIFEVMSRLAIQHKSINLGQGFPDNNGPDDVRKVAHEALEDRPNQYPPMMGVPELRQAVAAHNKRFYGIDVDWQTETLVTSGATEALSGCIFGLVEPGDEVVVFEPLYDSYLPILRRAGATPKLVRLEPPHWEIPRDKLTAAFSAKTKMILLNTPMNPAAKVFTRDELSLIAELCLKHDALAVCDEVYEHIIFDGRPHVPLMTLPGMRDRTIRIGSAGKTFSLTGWKVGYLTGAPGVLGPAARVHQFLTFTTPPTLQRATAYGLGKDDAYFRGLAGGMQAQRDRLGSGLTAIGF
ncbi:MAG: aminotransferase, partial [Pseudolabrys sp.]